MDFIKFLRSYKKGQASIEYVVLMAVLLGLLTVWLAGLFPNMRDNLKANFYDKAVTKILDDDAEPPPPPPPPPDCAEEGDSCENIACCGNRICDNGICKAPLI